MELYEMCQISKIIQHGYSIDANLQQYGQMLQNFYCFIFPFLSPLSSFFSFLFSLTLWFPFSSPCTGSLSLWPVWDDHRQWRRRKLRRRQCAPPPSISHAPSYAWSHSRLATLDLAVFTPWLSSISPSSLSSLFAFHSASL